MKEGLLMGLNFGRLKVWLPSWDIVGTCDQQALPKILSSERKYYSWQGTEQFISGEESIGRITEQWKDF
jgi:hypothetical protein